MTQHWFAKEWLKWACACLVYVALLLVSGQGWAFHDAGRDRVFDVNDPVDETRVLNMTPAEQRLLMEAQRPGISKWGQWKIMERDPDTGAILTCRKYARSHCRAFASYDDYQRFKIYQWQGKNRRRYEYFDNRYIQPTHGGNQWTWVEQPPQQPE